MKTDRRLAIPALLLVLMISGVAAQAQAVPCAAITHNPHVLEALIDNHSSTEGAGSPADGQIMSAADLKHLAFSPIVVQPGDALYVESRGKDFTIRVDYANGDFAAFDSSPKASDDQWRKGILPLDQFRAGVGQQLIKLAATGRDLQQVFFRNMRIIRAGRPVFEFAKLSSYGKPQVRNATQRQLPCKAFDEKPNLTPGPIEANYANESAEAVAAVMKWSAQPSAPLLTLTAQQVSEMKLDDPPMIHSGDVLIFEANRSDFVLHTYLSNWTEIVAQPLTREEAESTTVAWRKGRVRLDYPECVNQLIVGYTVTSLHQDGTPVMFRGIKIYRQGRIMLELEQSRPGPRTKPLEPPMSYPPDARVLTASVTAPSMLGREPATGFRALRLPAFSMPPLAMQTASGASGDPNHFKWNGKEFDAESGLYNFGARYYSPGLGRFVQPDPKIMSRQRMFDPQQWNMYSYSRNNPTSMTDPDGKEVVFANADQAKMGIRAATRGLPADQRGAVSVSASGHLQVDPAAAKAAGAGSLLGRLDAVATNSKVVNVHFVDPSEKIAFTKNGKSGETSLLQKTIDANMKGGHGVTDGTTLFDKGSKSFPEHSTTGETEAFISTTAQENTPAAFYEEVVVHAGTYFETGDVDKATHPAVNYDADRTASQVEANQKQPDKPRKKEPE